MAERVRGKRQRMQALRQASFTGRQAEIDLFRRLLPLDRQDETSLLMISGIGGIGKSALLDECARQAAAVNCWIARLDPRVQASILDFLTAIHDQLQVQARFPQYEAGVARRREIENKLLGHRDIPRNALELLVRGTRAAVQQVPLAGPVVAEFINPEQVTTAIYNAVGRADADFWLKPENDLTTRLVADLNAYLGRHRILLMFDNYEWIGEFDRWVREGLFEPLDSHVLFVLAGRRRLEGRDWDEFTAFTEQITLDPLTEGEAQTYLERKGISDPAARQVMADYAAGLPLYLAILAELAEHGGGVDNLGQVATRQESVDKLLERIKESMSASLSTALEACAVLRVVDEDNLAYMLEQREIGAVFEAVKRLDFVKKRDDGGLMLHEVVWDAMNQELRWRNAARYCELHERAAAYYEQALARPNVPTRERKELERLYHRMRANEAEGIKLFQQMAEGLVRFRLVGRLRELLSDVDYSLEDANSRLWREYYAGRLAHLTGSYGEAEKIYQKISEDGQAEPKLRAYSLCDLSELWTRNESLSKPGGPERAMRIVERSKQLAQQTDAKLITIFSHLRGFYLERGDWDRAIEAIEKQKHFFQQHNDSYESANILASLAHLYSIQGDWRKATDIMDQAKNVIGANVDLLSKTFATWFPLAWAGRYTDAEQLVKGQLDYAQQVGDLVTEGTLLKDWGFTLGLQGRFIEMYELFPKALQLYELRGDSISGIGILRGFWGLTLIRAGKLNEAQEQLAKALSIKQKVQDNTGIPEVTNWQGELHEVRAKQEQDGSIELAIARSCYEQSLTYGWIGRYYFHCGALTGLVRVRHAQGDYAALPGLLSEAEALAQQYEYNDYLASLRLTQGHAAWAGQVPEWGSGFDAALGHYREALIYGLRYNRFLLDEVLWGGGIGTPLQPIISVCLARSAEGQQMLQALADWWRTGANDLGTARPDTISPIPEGVALVDGERLAREREPGDGTPQHWVVAQIMHQRTTVGTR